MYNMPRLFNHKTFKINSLIMRLTILLDNSTEAYGAEWFKIPTCKLCVIVICSKIRKNVIDETFYYYHSGWRQNGAEKATWSSNTFWEWRSKKFATYRSTLMSPAKIAPRVTGIRALIPGLGERKKWWKVTME